MFVDLLVNEITTLYTMAPGTKGLGQISNASVGFIGGEVVWVGAAADAPNAAEQISGKHLIGMPGLVDCHTHAVWAGSRANEFCARLNGTHYSEILESGGGILSTVSATRNASLETLTSLCRQRLRGMQKRGVTTVEIKSGYGLNPEHEAKILTAALACSDTMRVITTFLGAHTIPTEFRSNRAAYVDQIINEQIPRCASLSNFIDVYCDRGAFTLDESLAILAAGQQAGMAVKAHAEQVEHTGIAGAAARLGAISVEHLERIDANGIVALAENDV